MDASNADRQFALSSALTALAKKGLHLHALESLGGGLTNANVIVGDGAERYVLRLNNPASEALGIDRALEARILQQLPVGTSLNVIEMTEHFMLTPFVEARQGLANHTEITSLLALLKQLHALHVDAPAIDYMARITELVGDTMDTVWQALLAKLNTALYQQEASFGAHDALCHHDLVAANILWPMGMAERPILIDWEYAARGDLFFDLACLLEEHKHLALSEAALLKNYGLDPQCAPKLRVYRAVYLALAAAWAGCRGLSNTSQLAYIEALLND